MKNIIDMSKVNRQLNRAGLILKKHSPEILLGVGIVGTIGATVMACKATTKAGDIVENAKKRIDEVHEVLNEPALKDKYTEEDSKKDRAIIYTQTGIEFIKLYGPSVILGAASIGCILASHNIIHKRNAVLTTAYAASMNEFKEYRNRVIERFGNELDRELKYNIKAQEVQEIVTKEDGSEEVVTSTVEVGAPGEHSMYTKCFDETCRGWTRNAEMNMYFLHQVQNWANEKLKRQGHLTLNEVYEKLGFDKTSIGAQVGWVYDEGAYAIGDNEVDFGIYELHNPEKRAFVNGREKSIWLDFNVDGYILDLI